MCGIAGQINIDPNEPIQPAILEGMADALRHRGPDRSRVWHAQNAGLAHRRLSVIDLSEIADQPMTNEDGTIRVVFNGEIYNYADLRESLIQKGHRFNSNTDTEILVHLYEDKGVEMLHDLRGMFAFAIWDANRQRLFAARDRVGKKPFKYFWDGNRLVFASELKALLKHPRISTTINSRQIHQYLCFGYMFSPNTGIDEIHKLPAAHYLLLENGKLQIHRYWRLDYSQRTSLSYEEATIRLGELFEESVKCRLESDVPLGAFLSGGIDSAAVVALMSRHMSKPVKTFSVGFDYETHNELPQARETARSFGCDHTEIRIAADTVAMLPELARAYEEPYGDSSALPSYLLARRTREFVTVALNGDGGDENFAGYIRYSNFGKLLSLIQWIKALKLAMPAKRFGSAVKSFPHPFMRRIGIIADLIDAPVEQLYARVIAKFTEGKLDGLYQDAENMLDALRDFPPPEFLRDTFQADWAGHCPMAKALHWDNEHYLAEDLCPKMDIATMASGLEARSPLLDHKLIEFSATLPIEWKIKGSERKLIFKEAMRSLLPASTLNRPKTGFGIPVHQWFRGDLGRYFQDMVMVPGARVNGYLNPKAIKAIFACHKSSRSDEGARLWMILTLELWLRWLGDPQ